jgi:hypothetical protein
MRARAFQVVIPVTITSSDCVCALGPTSKRRGTKFSRSYCGASQRASVHATRVRRNCAGRSRVRVALHPAIIRRWRRTLARAESGWHAQRLCVGMFSEFKRRPHADAKPLGMAPFVFRNPSPCDIRPGPQLALDSFPHLCQIPQPGTGRGASAVVVWRPPRSRWLTELFSRAVFLQGGDWNEPACTGYGRIGLPRQRVV